MNFPSGDVTYDNKESGLKSQNVQGAIDELYGICTAVPAGDQIIATSNLEKDPYECRYFFTGRNPNNYIIFNNESWRIISVECDSTIKIMRNASIGNQYWDTSGNNNWARPASLNTYLNETYYNELNANAQSQIVAKDWSIGNITWYNNDLAKQIGADDLHTNEEIIIYLNTLGNIVYLHSAGYGLIYMPKEVSDKQIESLYQLLSSFPKTPIYIDYNLMRKNGKIVPQEIINSDDSLRNTQLLDKFLNFKSYTKKVK